MFLLNCHSEWTHVHMCRCSSYDLKIQRTNKDSCCIACFPAQNSIVRTKQRHTFIETDTMSKHRWRVLERDNYRCDDVYVWAVCSLYTASIRAKITTHLSLLCWTWSKSLLIRCSLVFFNSLKKTEFFVLVSHFPSGKFHKIAQIIWINNYWIQICIF